MEAVLCDHACVIIISPARDRDFSQVSGGRQRNDKKKKLIIASVLSHL